jgi:predicted RNA-binding Zn-ribbon protein involved in translation (DUF1610 family)
VIQCPKCKSDNVYREHRSPEDRRKYAAVFECYDCGQHIGVSRLQKLLNPHMPDFLRMPWITVHARCPRCGNMKLQVFERRDYIEGYQRNLLRFVQRLLGAPLCYCPSCRLQFHDLRPRLTQKL